VTDSVEAVVIGAGVVGLAIARQLAKSGREVIVVEAANAIGTEISARNSEVIHAGIYYPAGSLKARLCVAIATITVSPIANAESSSSRQTAPRSRS
jgi:L-2-hydroxyglutarate oxidase LhgO